LSAQCGARRHIAQLGDAVPIRPVTPMALESGPQLSASTARTISKNSFCAVVVAPPEHRTADMWAARDIPRDFQIEP
jgi:hypothetical protein